MKLAAVTKDAYDGIFYQVVLTVHKISQEHSNIAIIFMGPIARGP